MRLAYRRVFGLRNIDGDVVLTPHSDVFDVRHHERRGHIEPVGRDKQQFLTL